MGIIISLLVGAVSGWLAGQIMKGGGYGLLWNIILGLLGGLVGPWLFAQLNISAGAGIVGEIITAAAGAVVIVFVAGLLKK